MMRKIQLSTRLTENWQKKKRMSSSEEGLEIINIMIWIRLLQRHWNGWKNFKVS